MKNFLIYQRALAIARTLRPLLDHIGRHDRDLERQLRRAMPSVLHNLAEGNWRVGKDRLQLFRVAGGSAAEVLAGVQLACAWGYVDEALAGPFATDMDELLAMLWRLTRPARP